MTASTPPGEYRSYYRNFFRDFPNFTIRLTKHARTRMEERDIRLPQIRTVLMSGSLLRVEPDIRTGLDKYRVSGHDADGRWLEIVANLDETGAGRVVIVTAIDSPDAGGSARREKTDRGGPSPSGGKQEARALEVEGNSVSSRP